MQDTKDTEEETGSTPDHDIQRRDRRTRGGSRAGAGLLCVLSELCVDRHQRYRPV